MYDPGRGHAQRRLPNLPLSKVDAPGETWHQLEPCRHWVCGGCGEVWMQEHARNSCPQCRETIAIYVRARSSQCVRPMPAQDMTTACRVLRARVASRESDEREQLERVVSRLSVLRKEDLCMSHVDHKRPARAHSKVQSTSQRFPT